MLELLARRDIDQLHHVTGPPVQFDGFHVDQNEAIGAFAAGRAQLEVTHAALATQLAGNQPLLNRARPDLQLHCREAQYAFARQVQEGFHFFVARQAFTTYGIGNEAGQGAAEKCDFPAAVVGPRDRRGWTLRLGLHTGGAGTSLWIREWGRRGLHECKRGNGRLW